jgi:membrane-associated phospholipid phosphatase
VSRDGSPPNFWPRRECWVAFVRYAVLIQLLWLIVYGGCSWLTAHRSHRVPLAVPWDALIPFVPEAAAVYLSLGPMLWLSPFLLKSTTALRDFAKALAWLIAVAGLGFLLLPADAPIVPERAASANRTLMSFADMGNLDHNLCPSLHVGMAVVCAVFYSGASGPVGTVLCWAWAIAIAISTLLIRDHFLVDVVAGAVLGSLIAARCAARTRRGGSQRITPNS